MPNATRPRAGVLAIIMFMSVAMVMAANAWQPVNWDRGEAVRAAAQTDTFATREALRQLALAGGGKELLDLLESTSTRADWPLPARENVLHDFAESLRGMPPGSVSPEVMGFLGDYRSQVLITRAEHPVTGVAMYNIRSVAHGVQHTWDRQEAAFEGAALLGRDPLALVGRFDSAGPAARQGYLDALDTATPGQLETVCFLALSHLDQAPDLTALAGQAALGTGDARALEQLARTGSGPAMARVLRSASGLLTTDQSARLLQTAILEGSHETAALAIANLSPALAGHRGAEDTLLDLLGDPALGSSAALALARRPDTETLQRLDRIAIDGQDSLEARRARLALDINRTQYAREID